MDFVSSTGTYSKYEFVAFISPSEIRKIHKFVAPIQD